MEFLSLPTIVIIMRDGILDENFMEGRVAWSNCKREEHTLTVANWTGTEIVIGLMAWELKERKKWQNGIKMEMFYWQSIVTVRDEHFPRWCWEIWTYKYSRSLFFTDKALNMYSYFRNKLYIVWWYITISLFNTWFAINLNSRFITKTLLKSIYCAWTWHILIVLCNFAFPLHLNIDRNFG